MDVLLTHKEIAMAGLRKGSKVSWNWGANVAHGKIVERFTQKITRTIKGTEVTREASTKEPAFLIEQEDGDQVLKSGSELKRD
jgi:hypothetical protein